MSRWGCIDIGLTRRVSPENETAPELTSAPDQHPFLLLYTQQVESYYSLPEERWPKSGLRFSPSEAGKCPRELFYAYTNAEADSPQPRRPLRSRIADVGNGIHAERQRHIKKMPDALLKNGIDVHFRIKAIDGKPAIETSFEREITHKGETFKIKGRLDGIIEFINADGEVIGETIIDWKVKTLKKKLKQLDREVAKYTPQMACYRMLTGIPVAIIDFESAQKDWSKDGPNEDVEAVLIEITDDMCKFVLDKFAHVAACVRTNTVPAMEREEFYCANLCPYSQTCHNYNIATIGGAA